MTESSAGSLSGQTATAVGGMATFSNVVYTASVDGESFTLVADDAVGGGEGDLPFVFATDLSSDILATQLVFSTQPSGSVSGVALTTQPVVVAQDVSGNVDIDFSDIVALSESSSGSLSGQIATAVSGVAVFSNVAFTASTDKGSFVMMASDESGGNEGKLPVATSQAVVSEVIATELAFLVQPSGSVSGNPFSIQPLVIARDNNGVIDIDFSEQVMLTANGAGTLQNGSVQAVSGVAAFTSVSYSALSGNETFRLTAQGGNLSAAISDDVSSQVVATRLVFVVEPAGSVSNHLLAVQPIVEAQDDNGVRDVAFSDVITLTVDGLGQVEGHVGAADSGRVLFPHLIYHATSDGEIFKLIANDEPGGTEGDLPDAVSIGVQSDVVGTRLAFTTQPSGSVSGKALQVQPIVVVQDSAGIVDTDISELITLTTSAPGILEKNSVMLQNGVATFSDVEYYATSDGEEFSLTANDGVGGIDLVQTTSNDLISDVVATHLAFTTQPSGSISGQAFLGQPVVVAQDSAGIVDTDFSDTVFLATSASGTLHNGSMLMQNGVVVFSDVAYTAVVDQSKLLLVADDAVGGIDLLPGLSDSLVCDVIANEFVFGEHPSEVVSGRVMPFQIVVTAQNQGIVDIDFDDVVSLGSSGKGTLIGGLSTAVSGSATFNGITYHAAEDKEVFSFQADDVAGGIEGDLPLAASSTLTADVIAVQLVFVAYPSGIISGQPFLTQPQVAAQDSLGVTDIDFSDVVTLSVAGDGDFLSTPMAAVSGLVSFSDALYTASQSLEVFVLTADDESGGQEGDLPPSVTPPLTAGSGPPHHLDFVLGSKELVANGVSTRAILVRVLDESNNVRVEDEITQVSLSVTGAGTGGEIQRVARGEATFSVTSTTQVGVVYLHAGSEGLIAAVDSFITIPGAAEELVVTYDNTPLPADGVSTREIRISLVDAHHNLLTQNNSTMIALGVSGAGTGGGTLRVTGGQAVFSVQAGLEPGILKLRANASGVPEVSETLIVGSVAPDLVISGEPVGPDHISRDTLYLASLDIQNIGTGPTSKSFNVALYLVGGRDSVRMGESTVTQTILPDSSIHVGIPFTTPPFSFAAPVDTYNWVVQVDDGNFIAESSEANNAKVGGLVRFPILSLSESNLDFGATLSGSVAERFLIVENGGQAELSFEVVTSDSQLTAQPHSVENLAPGQNILIRVSLVPESFGPFSSILRFQSNDPKGDVLVLVSSMIAVPDRVFFDFDPAPGNQAQSTLDLGRNETFSVEVFLSELPQLQAITVDLRYDSDLLTFVPKSWEIGDFFGGGVRVFEEDLQEPGHLLVSAGAFENSAIFFDASLGKLEFTTSRVLPSSDGLDVLETALEAVQIRYLQENGIQDSLRVFAQGTVRFVSGAIWPDFDGDGIVAFPDFLIFIGAFRQEETSPGWDTELPEKPFPQTPYNRFDIDGDGRVGFFDFVTYAQAFKTAVEATEVEESQ